MTPEPVFRQFLLAMGETTAPERDVKPWFRETLDTSILGCLSCSVGIIVLIVVISGIVGKRVEDWHKNKPVLNAKSTPYLEPSDRCAIAVVAGEALGLTGIALAWIRGRTISLLSILGTIMCLIHIFIFFSSVILTLII
jgi:hypothetical protein